jgi:hypothetical protein
VEELPLDRLLRDLEALSFRGARAANREVLDRSIAITETLIRRRKLAPDTCLFRALGRYALLRAQGVDAAFCLGVHPPPAASTGHAWVEDTEGPYLEEIGEGAYVVTFAYPPTPGDECRAWWSQR